MAFAKVTEFVRQHAPTILSSLAVAGVVATTVLAVKATPKAVEILQNEQRALEEQIFLDEEGNEEIPVFPVTAKVRATWRLYIPAAAAGAVTIGCIVGSHRISLKRSAAALTAYYVADEALQAYRRKTEEVVGAKKAVSIHDAVMEENARNHPQGSNNPHRARGGNVLCYDAFSGRYFLSDIETLRKAQNDINQRLFGGSWISLNELYCEIGLPGIKLGEDLGWVPENMVDIVFTSMLTDGNEPCVVVDFRVEPRYSGGAWGPWGA